jgi:hypothetical protein
VAKCCPRLEWNTLYLSREKAHAKGLGVCGWLKAPLWHCPLPCWRIAQTKYQSNSQLENYILSSKSLITYRSHLLKQKNTQLLAKKKPSQPLKTSPTSVTNSLSLATQRSYTQNPNPTPNLHPTQTFMKSKLVHTIGRNQEIIAQKYPSKLPTNHNPLPSQKQHRAKLLC